MVTSRAHPVRVLCVDDSLDITDVLVRCIAAEPDLQSVGSLDSADGVIDVVKRTHPHVVLMDLSMPGKDPVQVVRELAELYPPSCGTDLNGTSDRAVRVILFSGHDDPDTVASAADAGACGFLSKDAGIQVVLQAIRTVASAAVPFGVWR